MPCVIFDGKSEDFATEMFVIINSTPTRINKSHLVDLYERVSWAAPDKKFAARVVEQPVQRGRQPAALQDQPPRRPQQAGEVDPAGGAVQRDPPLGARPTGARIGSMAAARRKCRATTRWSATSLKAARNVFGDTVWAKPSDLPQAEIPAFPGAQGGGMYSFGGRGGKVFVVTNLERQRPGQLSRSAAKRAGRGSSCSTSPASSSSRSEIRIRAPYITIDGGSAPGDGVCIAGDTVELETHDVVIRHMRFRRGETWVGDRNDSLGGNPIGNIMIDHVSASWGLDENMSMYRHMYQPPDGSKELKLPTVNITIQNSIFSEASNTYNHSFGSTIGGYNSTFHHNLWACNAGRNPSIGMIYDFTFANNVLFNWRHRTVDGGDHRSFYTIINNYFKPGPATPQRRADQPIACSSPSRAAPSRRSTTTARRTSPATSSKATTA